MKAWFYICHDIFCSKNSTDFHSTVPAFSRFSFAFLSLLSTFGVSSACWSDGTCHASCIFQWVRTWKDYLLVVLNDLFNKTYVPRQGWHKCSWRSDHVRTGCFPGSSSLFAFSVVSKKLLGFCRIRTYSNQSSCLGTSRNIQGEGRQRRERKF